MQFKSGMISFAVAYLSGVLLVQYFSVLPTLSSWLFYSFIFIFSGCLLRHLVTRNLTSHKIEIKLIIYHIILIYIGISLSIFDARQQLAFRLPELLSGTDIQVIGYVSDVPVKTQRGQRFEFKIEAVMLPDTDYFLSTSKTQFPGKVRISWYGGTEVKAGDSWRLLIRLKPPHGFQNPGGFDYESWLFQHGIHATGYVRQSTTNQPWISDNDALSKYINRLRQQIGDQISHSSSRSLSDDNYTNSDSMIRALAVGDKSTIGSEQWKVLAATGTSHLMAISGLHIGLASLFAYVLVRRIVPGSISVRIPTQHIAIGSGLVVAFLYSTLAGLSIPTQRAFIMLVVIASMMFLRRNYRPADILGLALFTIVLIDQAAVLSIGFWFSFSAVAVIFLSVAKGETDQNSVDSEPDIYPEELVKAPVLNIKHLYVKVITILSQWFRLQLMISIFLLPLSLYMFQQVSLVSPLANLILIPYISLLVVPVILLAIVLSFVCINLSDILFIFSTLLLDAVWPLLVYLSQLPFAVLKRGDISLLNMLLSIGGILLLYNIKTITTRISEDYLKSRYRALIYCCTLSSAIFMIVPIFVNSRQHLKNDEFILTVLDVGQGSAAVIQTKEHALIFDTGDKYSDRFDAGSGVVIPYIRHSGIATIDKMVISHGDSDHIGGAQAIINAFPDVEVVGQDIDKLKTKNKILCQRGMAWQWNGVSFEFISPELGRSTQEENSAPRNNRSCVMKVASSAGSLLLTGDIERQTENELVAKYNQHLKVDVVIVPHHGSKTSSSQSLIRVMDADYAIISAGYRNRYRLPNQQVVSRYEGSMARLFRTDESGAITVHFTKEKGVTFERYRVKSRRYWYHILASDSML